MKSSNQDKVEGTGKDIAGKVKEGIGKAVGNDRLRAEGHEVDVQLGLSADELLGVVPGAQALIIRSATDVTDAVLAAGSDLMVVGRAGIGLDNVDVESATTRGVMVVNAPQSNIVSAAEHTMALLLASARNVPQAHAALVQGARQRQQVGRCGLHKRVVAAVAVALTFKDDHRRRGRQKAAGMQGLQRQRLQAAHRRRQGLGHQRQHAQEAPCHQGFGQHGRPELAAGAHHQQRQHRHQGLHGGAVSGTAKGMLQCVHRLTVS